jgi:EmrB/QacA subfamily drug resistance transporter
MTQAASPSNGAATPSLAEDPALGLSHRAKMEILGAVLLGLFLGALDQTIVGTALPKIVTDLGGNDLYVWVVTIYLLTSTISVPFYGKLSDIYGRRPMLMIGITLFLVGSALSGLSQEMWQLILFRGIQGLGAGALFPISLAVIGDLFTPAERGKYQGLFGAVFGISFIVGPALGGFLTDNVSWHWVFYVNLPVGLISLYVIWRLLPTIKAKNVTRTFDYLGALVFTIAIGILLVGLTNKGGVHKVGTVNVANDWSDVTVGGFIAIGLLLGAVFVWIESRAKEAIVPLDLWRNRTYVSSMLATFLVSFGFFGAIIFLPRWFQSVRGDTATASGYEIFPLLIGLIGSSIVAGFLVARTGKYKVLVLTGVAIMAVGLVLMTTISTNVPIAQLWFAMFVTGIGIGPTLSVFTIIVQNAVPFNKLGVATSNLTFFRQIGGSIGLAIAGTIFANALSSELPKQIGAAITANVPPAQQAGVSQQLGSFFGSIDLQALTGVRQSFGALLAGHITELAPFVKQFDAAFFNSFSYGVSQTFLLGVGAAAAGLVASLAMREIPLRRTTGPVPAAVPAAVAGQTARQVGADAGPSQA